jgi:hypothetical protein
MFLLGDLYRLCIFGEKKITVKHSAQKPELKMNFLVAHFEMAKKSKLIFFYAI